MTKPTKAKRAAHGVSHTLAVTQYFLSADAELKLKFSSMSLKEISEFLNDQEQFKDSLVTPRLARDVMDTLNIEYLTKKVGSPNDAISPKQSRVNHRQEQRTKGLAYKLLLVVDALERELEFKALSDGQRSGLVRMTEGYRHGSLEDNDTP